MEAKEITVILQFNEKTVKQKFLIHDDFQMSSFDPVIKACILETRQNIEEEPESITIKALLSNK